MFCKHDWVKISENTLPSANDQMLDEQKRNATTIPLMFFQRTYILVLKCSKCGKLDKTIVTNIRTPD